MQKIGMLLALAFICTGINAQVQRKLADTNSTKNITVNEDMDNSGKSGTRMDKLKLMKELNLTKEQKGKLKEMKQANQFKKEAILNDTGLTEIEKQEKLKQVKHSAAIDLQSVLTGEQKQKLQKMRRERANSDSGANDL